MATHIRNPHDLHITQWSENSSIVNVTDQEALAVCVLWCYYSNFGALGEITVWRRVNIITGASALEPPSIQSIGELVPNTQDRGPDQEIQPENHLTEVFCLQ